MALIGKIRKNSWLLIVMLALGLGGFVAMDMINNASRSSGNQFTIGEVNGEKLDWNEFQRAERILYPNSTGDVYGQRSYIWNYMVEEQLLKEEAEALGLGVSVEEMEELQYGARLSPVIQRNFRDPNTGQMDRATLDQIKANLGTGKLQPQLEEFWGFQSKEIVKDRLQNKIAALIKKSIYTPTWMAQQLQAEQGSSIDFTYVLVPFDKIADADVKLTDDDFKSWMKENEGMIERKEETRTVDFVVFNVVPTPEDSIIVREAINERIAAFRVAENDSQFVENNYGQIEATYFKKEDLAESIADTVFDLPVGTVYGPYIDGVAYKAFKILDKKTIADSVKSRHILIRAESADEIIAATAKIDSIKTIIEAGITPFDSMAMRISQDGSAQSGGDLGWSAPKRMVQPYDDVLFYSGEPGKLSVATTQFGVHLIEITGRKFIDNEQGVKLAYLAEPIVPSEETQAAIYDDALEFSGQNRTLDAMKAAVEKNPALSLESAPNLPANGYQFSTLGSGGTSRDIIRWAFEPDTKEGYVAPEVYVYDEPTLFYNARYVVPALKLITKEGVMSLADVKEAFTPQVTLKKKGEMLAAKITSKDLNAVASEYGVEVDTFNNVNFNMSYLQGLGNENTLIGKVTSLNQGEVAGPIIGVGGVYLAQVISRAEASLSTDIAAFRRQVSQSSRSSIDSRLMEAIKSTAKIEDNRFNFY
ncbi:MAG TPA: peptidylprolyl isomerase [Saprospiraceae bacterium]